jgi:uncharacterized membrane protein (DUF4010 family)
VLLAWLVMFIRVPVTVAIVFKPLVPALLIPFGTMAVVTACIAGAYYWQSKRQNAETELNEVKVTNPFSLIAAIKFGLMLAAVLLMVKLTQLYAPTEALYLVAALAGLTEVHAITLTMADYARSASGGLTLAAGAITVAALTNTVVKCGMVMLTGSKELARKLVFATSLILLSGGISIAILRFF